LSHSSRAAGRLSCWQYNTGDKRAKKKSRAVNPLDTEERFMLNLLKLDLSAF
jgi:hypothetical protein